MPTAPRQHRPARLQAMQPAKERRPSSYARGYNKKWSAYAKSYLNDNLACRVCGMSAQCVDHIEPHQGQDDPLFWDESNHQPLCARCHSKKTAKRDGGFGNQRTRSNAGD